MLLKSKQIGRRWRIEVIATEHCAIGAGGVKCRIERWGAGKIVDLFGSALTAVQLRERKETREAAAERMMSDAIACTRRLERQAAARAGP